MHLLGQLLVTLSLLLRCTLVFDCLNAFLQRSAFGNLSPRAIASTGTRCSTRRDVGMCVRCEHTWRSASFSSFISFSLAFTAARAVRAFTRLSQGLVAPVAAPGRKAVFGACHCLPIVMSASRSHPLMRVRVSYHFSACQ